MKTGAFPTFIGSLFSNYRLKKSTKMEETLGSSFYSPSLWLSLNLLSGKKNTQKPSSCEYGSDILIPKT